MYPYPLSRAHRLRLAQAFATVPRIDIGIECVLEEQMGKAFVDSLETPQFFMIELDNFFVYFAGDFTKSSAENFISKIPKSRMLMAGSEGWQEKVETSFFENLIKIERYNYSSENLSSENLRNLIASSPHTAIIQKVDLELAQSHPPFLEFGAFDSPEDFIERGIGFCAIKNGTVIGAAYSSLVANTAIEVSVIVEPEYYRQGIATALCANLLLYCVENKISAHWDAANEESCRLAEKLGYRKIETYYAYFLKASS